MFSTSIGSQTRDVNPFQKRKRGSFFAVPPRGPATDPDFSLGVVFEAQYSAGYWGDRERGW